MSLLHVLSKVCMALFPCAEKNLHCALPYAPHMEGNIADFAPHMKGSHADFTPHIGQRYSFRDKKIAGIANSANFQNYLL